MRNICIIGVGYVGLPLAVEFGKKQHIKAFDINKKRIEELKNNTDSSGEISSEDIQKADIEFSSNPKVIGDSDFIIIAVPTPIDKNEKPDTSFIESATKIVGKYMKKCSIIVYESTVYPGATEEICIPLLEKGSGLRYKKDFKIGYSPERINPGDKVHTIDKIVKIVSGDDEESLNIIADIYSQIITTGVFKASSIKVAEAAKLVENVQRDVNIAFMNELKKIFDSKSINIWEVLEASGTKWNFLKFHPGLVGGHCIAVDPYYLIDYSEKDGYTPQLLKECRKINEQMAKYEAGVIIKKLKKANPKLEGFKLLILGAAFKPNVSDLRNSKIKIVADELKSEGCDIKIWEPLVKEERIFGYENISDEEALKEGFQTCVYAVKHDFFEEKIEGINKKFTNVIHLLK